MFRTFALKSSKQSPHAGFVAGFLLLLTIAAQPALALERSNAACVAGCAEILQHDIGYQIQVRDLDGAVLFHEAVRLDRPQTVVQFKEPQVVEFAKGLDLSKGTDTRTTVINTPLPGGGSIVTITARIGPFNGDRSGGGTIISNTLLRIGPSGQVLDIVDLMMER